MGNRPERHVHSRAHSATPHARRPRARPLVVHKLEGKWDRTVDKTVFSFDIECAGRAGKFPKPQENPVIQICNSVVLDSTGTPYHVAMSLGSANGTLSAFDKKLERVKRDAYENAVAAWRATGSEKVDEPPVPEFVAEGWDPTTTTVLAYPLLRDASEVARAVAALGDDNWEMLFLRLRRAVSTDGARLGGQRMRSLLVGVDSRLRQERHRRDKIMHDALRDAEPWRFSKAGSAHADGFPPPKLPGSTDVFRYGWLDVAHLVTGRRGILSLTQQLVVLAYFFPRLRAVLSNGTYVDGDDWYSSTFHPERASQAPTFAALEPSRVRAPFRRDGDPDDELSAVDRTEKERMTKAVRPLGDGLVPGTRCPQDGDFVAVQAAGAGCVGHGSLLGLVVRVLANLLGCEARLLGDWGQLVRSVQPHVVTGYNILRFDIPYVRERAAVLGVRTLTYLGTMHTPANIARTVFTSRGTGAQKRVEVTIGGCTVLMDMYTVMVGSYKLMSYKLNAVSAHFLGRTKEDVAYFDITPLYEKDDAGRSRVLRYCIKDALLPLELMRHLKVLFVKTEMVRVTGVTLNTLLTRGQGVLTHSMLVRLARQFGRICPVLGDRRESQVQFQGATVVVPKRGFYLDPISTLDYA
jgi:hypothetical protein